MILLIDNYDSFTYNLYQQLESLGARTEVVTHDHITLRRIKKLKPSRIVISPGPGRPDQSGNCCEVISALYRSIPILGVCLGLECIGEVFGARVVQARRILHGKTAPVHHGRQGLFAGIPNPFEAARYHSLVIDSVPQGFVLDARDDYDEIMAIRHATLPVYGIQFHPESFMTHNGNRLLRNFLYEN
ncbi:MAG: aminodeoxychorismate/anthranilate synthase component II [Deltaproteobacteria bacterium]|nr:aminodeoxychorismate/anthranilate synthase component II [Deltaproteobacteria bacterium]